MSLAAALDKLKLDKRLLEFNVSRGRLSAADRDKYLAGLPDLASNVENLGLATAPEEELDESLYLPEDDEEEDVQS